MQKSMVDEATDAAVAVKDAATQAADSTQQVAGEMNRAVQKSVKDQPMATLAITVALGFVLGALWKS